MKKKKLEIKKKKKFLLFGPKSSISWNIRTFFLGENIRNFFKGNILRAEPESALGSPIYYYFGWGSGNDKQTMNFVFITKTRHKTVSRGNDKIIVTGKKMSKLLSCDCLATHYNMVKYDRHVEKRLILSL